MGEAERRGIRAVTTTDLLLEAILDELVAWRKATTQAPAVRPDEPPVEAKVKRVKRVKEKS